MKRVFIEANGLLKRACLRSSKWSREFQLPQAKLQWPVDSPGETCGSSDQRQGRRRLKDANSNSFCLKVDGVITVGVREGSQGAVKSSSTLT